MLVPRIGSLCTGYGGLDLAIMEAVAGAQVAWHAQYDPDDRHQYAARILAHRWPGIPNLGDITRADWFEAEPVHILTAGYPCQPISFAGKGLVTDDPRWIWPAVAQCIRLLRPGLVFLENVAAHLVRGLGDVIAGLARIGYVGSWLCLRASDIGAPHQRKRLFILARPADADPDSIRAHGAGTRGAGSDEPTARHQSAADAAGQRTGEPTNQAQPISGGWDARPVLSGRSVLAAANAGCDAWSQDNAYRAAPGGRGRATADTHGGRCGPDQYGNAARQPDAAWGNYGPAIRRWEAILGRAAPAPVDDRGRLAPPFVEWMMGAPAGWVTDISGIPRNAQLRALGSGVVVQQGAEAARRLLARTS